MGRFHTALVWVALLSMGAVVFGLLSLIYPDLVNSDLRAELAATGLMIGHDRADQMLERYGPPSHTVQEHLSTKYEYASLGILFRFDSSTDQLNWVEFTGSTFRTGKGIGIGSPVEAVLDAYGQPSEQVKIGEITRLRYTYGIKYTLEFRLISTGEVSTILFYLG